MIRQAVFSLIRPTSEAIVVDLPAPVIPVSRTSPALRSMMSSQTLFGKPIFSMGGTSSDRARIAAARPSFSRKMLMRNCSDPMR